MWLTEAAERGIEHLNIRLSRDPSLSRSCCIFSSRTLVVLKLEGMSLHASLTVDFPSLKILHLIGVIFSGGWSIWELLIGCPILEDFKAKNIYLMEECDNPEYKSLTKLVRADISDMGNWDIPLKIFCNIDFLRLGDVCIYGKEKYICLICYSFSFYIISIFFVMSPKTSYILLLYFFCSFIWIFLCFLI